MKKCERCEATNATPMILTIVKTEPEKVVGTRTYRSSRTTNLDMDLCPMCVHDLRLAFGKINAEITKAE